MAKVITLSVCGIYKITSPIGRIYIGQSRDIISRFKDYRLLTGGVIRQTRLFRSLMKHGWQAHFFEVITTCAIEDLDALEVYFIAQYNSFNSANGLNLTSGGKNPRLSDETRQRLSLIMKSRPNEINQKISETWKARNYKPFLGKRHSQESIEKIRGAKTGIVASEETRAKMSDSRIGKRHTDQAREKMRENNSRRRPIVDSVTGKVYKDAGEAAFNLNMKRTTLCAMLSGKSKNKTQLKYKA